MQIDSSSPQMIVFLKIIINFGTFAEVVVHSVAMMAFEVTMKKLPVNQKKSSYLISEEYCAVGRTEEDAGFVCTCL